MVLGKLGVERQRRKVGPLVHANHRQSLKVDHGARCKRENCKVIGKKQWESFPGTYMRLSPTHSKKRKKKAICKTNTFHSTIFVEHLLRASLCRYTFKTTDMNSCLMKLALQEFADSFIK